jgi:hypothetical protein
LGGPAKRFSNINVNVAMSLKYIKIGKYSR